MSAHLTDSEVYGHLWASPEVRALFTDGGRTSAWLDILATLAEAQADVGMVPQAAAEAIRRTVTTWRPDMAELGVRTRETGHSTMGLIQMLQQVLPKEAGGWVYYGATVQDLTDTWFALVMRTMTTVLRRDLDRARGAAAALASRYRNTVMCGRSHGQPGLPITFGFKAAVWAAELDRHLDRLEEGRSRRELVQIGGGLGTMEFWGAEAESMSVAFADRLGLAVPALPWLTARDGVAEFVSLLALVTGTVAKIGDEVYELQREEIGELREPLAEGTVGSITMPHKRNPELSELVNTLARLVRADASLALEGLVHGHERDGRAWKTEWLILPEACMYAAASVAAAVRLLEGLEVDAERMRANLDRLGGYPMSGPVMRALSDHIGKHTAQMLVHRAALEGRERGVDLRTALESAVASAPGLALDAAQFDRLLDPDRALGSIPRFIDAVLARTGRLSVGGVTGGGADGCGHP
ncbi:adenylosuccinate lyase family protein [Nocardioides marmoriginsengisoli]|uniref:Adenylosuccinate lyase family protein n=1 Tax=Nocardioides marmoriginsengisoli TaxID=661483 RepID=A0A3N0CIR4_9ACTN|nr:adenylosuccinate lyase family protein [Nocardioides marmoriginsengisoli]RNL62833.1 adenylosuccinate lyase family protein [Nocardioides marmoriginsengisoli]